MKAGKLRHQVTIQRLVTLVEYLSLPGVSNNRASTPDSAAISLTGDIDIRVKAALDDWTPASTSTLMAKWNTTLQSNGSFIFWVTTAGFLEFVWSPTGASAALITATSTAAPTVTDGEPSWLRVTMDANDGAGGREVKFWTSEDGESWTQLGDTVTGASTSIYDSNASLSLGALSSGVSPLAGDIYKAELSGTIGGANVACFDPATDAAAGDTTVTSSTTGEIWTISSSGSPGSSITGDSQNAVGEPNVGWADYLTVWASVDPVTGNEPFLAQQHLSRVTSKIRMRYRSGVTSDMRVSYGGNYYDIKAVLNWGERNAELMLLCEQGVNQG